MLCFMAAGLAGCKSNGPDIADRMNVDTLFTTGSLLAAMNNTELSDAMIVRNAASSANISIGSGNPVPWANSSSGSTGVISNISEKRVNGVICRRFATTLHSYEGVSQFNGTICLLNSGNWVTTDFVPRR